MSPRELRELGDVRDDVCSALPANVFTRHSGLDPESRNNPHPALNPRHSGPDPESSVRGAYAPSLSFCHPPGYLLSLKGSLKFSLRV